MSLRVRFDFAPAAGLADQLDSVVDKALLTLSAVDAVNEVGRRFEASAKAGMNARLSLSDAYIATRMRSTPANGVTEKVARFRIAAFGGGTILARYPYMQLSQAAPGAKGDRKRGIPAGSKQAGVSTTITTGSPVSVQNWFTMTLRRGKDPGDSVGLFYRGRGGKPEHRYAPAPYQLFSFQVEAQREALLADLQNTGAQAAADTIRRAVEKVAG